MTTSVTVDAHAGWPVRVTITQDGLQHVERIEPFTKRTFYVHSGYSIFVQELAREDAEREPELPLGGNEDDGA